MSHLWLTASPAVNYDWSQAWADLSQISPIVVVCLTLFATILVDLILPKHLLKEIIPSLASLGLVIALINVCWLWANGNGHLAYQGFATGDNFALFFEAFFAILGILTVGISHSYLERQGLRQSKFHVLILATIAGMMVLAAATSLVSIFIGLELFSVALYVACGFARSRTSSQESAAKYLIFGGFASAFVLYGMALIYGATGSTLLSEISKQLGSQAINNPLLLVGVLLLGVGFAYKISGAPFHMWTPDVYQGAPLPITALMSVGTKAAAFAMIIRVFLFALPQLASEWQILLAFTAAASIIVGNLMAIIQTSAKRLLAYSGVAQAGYILTGILAGGDKGTASVLFYLFAYLLMTFGAFTVLTMNVKINDENDHLENLKGLGYRQIWIGISMTIFMLSLAGFPFTIGFVGKLFLFISAFNQGFGWLVVLAALGSVISVFYYVRVIVQVWSKAPHPSEDLEISPAALFVSVFTGVFALMLFFFPAALLFFGQLGAKPIIGVGP